ncbi:Voltage-gated Ion Channel (VIC) Superfamily, partial [Thraustotheca clavata]
TKVFFTPMQGPTEEQTTPENSFTIKRNINHASTSNLLHIKAKKEATKRLSMFDNAKEVNTIRGRTRRLTMEAKEWVLSRSSRKSSQESKRVSIVKLVGSTFGVESLGTFELKLHRATQSWEIRRLDTKTLDPNALWISIWQTLLLCIVLYDALVIPFMICLYDINSSVCDVNLMYTAMLAADIFFLFDIFIQMHLGYYKNGDLIRNPVLTRRRYLLSKEFLLDALAIVPIYFAAIQIDCGTMNLNKLVRLRKVPTYTIEFDKIFARHFRFCKVVKVVIVSYFFGHYMACLYLSFGFSKGDEHDKWKLAPMYDNSFVTQYFAALYWSLGIISKCVEGEVPMTVLQTLFMHFVMFGGFLLFVYICGTLFMMSKCDTANQEELDAKVNQLRYVLSYHDVPKDLQDRAVEYIENGFRSGDTTDRSNMKLLCPSIAKDVKFTMLKEMVARVPFFQRCSNSFLRALIDLTETEAMPTNFTVIQEGDFGDTMYFVQSGVLLITLDNIKIKELRKGNSFGELSLFTNRARSASVVTTTFCILHKLGRLQVHQVLSAYPEFENGILDSVTKLLQEFDGENHKLVDPKRRSSVRHTLQGAGEIEKIVKIKKAPQAIIKENTRPMTTILRSSTISRLQRGSPSISGLRSRAKSLSSIQPNPSVLIFKHEEPYWKCFLLSTPIIRKSAIRRYWLFTIAATMWYNVFIVTLLNSFTAIGYPPYILLLNTFADIVYFGDIYAHLNLSYIVEAEMIMDPVQCARHYVSKYFYFDVFCAFPWWIFQPSKHLIFRSIRLFRCYHLLHEFTEITYLIRITSRRRIMILGFGLFMSYHLTACLAQFYALFAGYSHGNEGWLPPVSLAITWNYERATYVNDTTNEAIDFHIATEVISKQYLRALYYGAICVTNLGLPFDPEHFGEYLMSFIFMLTGMLLISVLIDEVQKRVTASALEQMEFLTKRSRIEHFLKNHKVPVPIHRRASAYLDFWWSIHRGANINDLAKELPNNLQRDIYSFICRPFLDVLARLDKIKEAFPRVSTIFLDNVYILLYGQGEMIYQRSDHADCLYMVLQGHVASYESQRASVGTSFGELGPGDIFGLAALEINNENAVYTDYATARSSCAIACITRENLERMNEIYSRFCINLKERVQKGQARRMEVVTRTRLEAVNKAHQMKTYVINPDTTYFVIWEIFVLFGIIFDCTSIPFYLAFGHAAAHPALRIFDIVFEIAFFIDILIKFRTGYWEYGNKIMDTARIRKRYGLSMNFLVDILAVIPLFVLNYTGYDAVELWHINKLLRLFKLSNQLNYIERHFYTISIQLRVFKIVFYIYLLAHYVGCAWYGFASNLELSDTNSTFGESTWLPSVNESLNLPNASISMIYAHSYYWGLGMLVGFQPGQHPDTSAESVFTIIVQTLGVFMLAYVIGNLLDIAKIMDGNNRMFYSNLNYVRKLIKYFDFSDEVESRVQHFYFYRLFHSIHEEHVLAKCLPPTLLADIRLFLLTPMLNKVPFFQEEHASSNITRVLVSRMTQILVTRGEVVCHQNEIGMEMFFVFAGCLEVYVAKNSTELQVTSPLGIYTFAAIAKGNKVNEINGGSFFGEKSLFSNQPRNASIEAKTFCTLFRLSRQHLEAVFAQYPEWKAKVMQIVKLLYKEQGKMQRDRITSQPLSSTKEQLSDLLVRRSSKMILNKVQPLQGSETQKHPHGKLRRQSSSFVTVLDVVRRGKGAHVPTTFHGRLAAALRVEAQSPFFRGFLRVLCCSILYNSVSIPFLLTFGHQGISDLAFALVMVANVLTDCAFLYDIWFKRHIIETPATREFYEQSVFPQGGIAFDIVCVLPFDYLLGPLFGWSSILRFNRFLKLKYFSHSVHEIHRFSMSYEVNRLALLGLYYILCVYWTACAYFGLTIVEGYGTSWESFLPSSDFQVDDDNPDSHHLLYQWLRCMYFATNMYTGAGIVHEPDSLLQYAFVFIVSIFGVFVLSYIIGEASSLFIYLIQNEVDFKISQMNLIEYMRRKRMDSVMETRIQTFLSYWWASQRGVGYQAILEQLPSRIRCQAVIQITRLSLSRFSMKYLRPLCPDATGIELVIYSIAQRLTFEGYPVGESVIVQGNIGKTMYFISKGTLISASTSADFLPSRFADGQFFGEEGFLGASVCQYSIVTLQACDLLSLTSSDFLSALHEHPLFFESTLIARDVVNRMTTCAANATTAPNPNELIWASVCAHAPELNYVKATLSEESTPMFENFVKLFVSHSAAEYMGTKWHKPLMCKRCDSDVAVYYCAECVQTMCAECSNKIHGDPQYSAHLQTITEISFYHCAIKDDMPSTVAPMTAPTAMDIPTTISTQESTSTTSLSESALLLSRVLERETRKQSVIKRVRKRRDAATTHTLNTGPAPRSLWGVVRKATLSRSSNVLKLKSKAISQNTLQISGLTSVNGLPSFPVASTSLRQRIWSLFHDPMSSTLARYVSIVLLGAVFVGSTIFIMQTEPSLASISPQLTMHTCIYLFSAEFAIRILCTPSYLDFFRDFFNYIDLISILPYYIELILNTKSASSVGVIRIMRLLRVARILKLSRYTSSIQTFMKAMSLSAKPLFMLMFLVAIAMIVFSSAVYFAEYTESGCRAPQYSKLCDPDQLPPPPDPFHSIAATFWWCIVSMTTVGYGDEVPVTPWGKFIASIAMMSGM